MALFVACRRQGHQHTVYVNVDLVRAIEQREEGTVVHFDREHNITIAGPPAALLKAHEVVGPTAEDSKGETMRFRSPRSAG